MSSRVYLSQRDALPGFTFLIIILVMNYTPLLEVINLIPIQPLVGAVLGIFTIMSGSAIGFHVSRLWWWWFQYRGGGYNRGQYNTMIEEFGLTRCKDKESIRGVISIWGYFFHNLMGKKEKSELVKYCQRRWDLYHTFSATIVSILLGLIIGIVYRILFVIIWGYRYYWPKEPVFHVFLIFAFLVDIYLLIKNRKDIICDYDIVSNALIMDQSNRIENLKDLFPNEYFNHSKQ